eukprot:jgi/Picre1/35172/NNA_002634.t1
MPLLACFEQFGDQDGFAHRKSVSPSVLLLGGRGGAAAQRGRAPGAGPAHPRRGRQPGRVAVGGGAGGGVAERAEGRGGPPADAQLCCRAVRGRAGPGRHLVRHGVRHRQADPGGQRQRRGAGVGLHREVMSTGLAQQRVEASRLYRFADPEELRSVESVLVPSAEDGSVTMFRVSKITAVPNVSATVYTVDGTTLEVDDAGLVVVEQGDEGGASGRRLLFADDPYAPTILGTTYSSRRGRIPHWCSRECDAAKRCGKYDGTKYNTCMDACERDKCP